jgi:hypothetical protein
MASQFIVHRHSTGRVHFDLRVTDGERLRCWSLLKEPPLAAGQSRLAIERESFAAEAIHARRFEEQAFGLGNVRTWDEGTVQVSPVTPRHLVLVFGGNKLAGRYEMKKMRWYPGNKWLMEKSASSSGNLA